MNTIEQLQTVASLLLPHMNTLNLSENIKNRLIPILQQYMNVTKKGKYYIDRSVKFEVLPSDYNYAAHGLKEYDYTKLSDDDVKNMFALYYEAEGRTPPKLALIRYKNGVAKIGRYYENISRSSIRNTNARNTQLYHYLLTSIFIRDSKPIDDEHVSVDYDHTDDNDCEEADSDNENVDHTDDYEEDLTYEPLYDEDNVVGRVKNALIQSCKCKIKFIDINVKIKKGTTPLNEVFRNVSMLSARNRNELYMHIYNKREDFFDIIEHYIGVIQNDDKPLNLDTKGDSLGSFCKDMNGYISNDKHFRKRRA